MVDIDKQNINIDEKLATLRFICDNKSHILVDYKLCRKCKDKPCLYVCPANVYTEGDAGVVSVEYENCIECGTCRVCCPENAICWSCPAGSMGVKYRFG